VQAVVTTVFLRCKGPQGLETRLVVDASVCVTGLMF
jgi:hypothetical protein